MSFSKRRFFSGVLARIRPSLDANQRLWSLRRQLLKTSAAKPQRRPGPECSGPVTHREDRRSTREWFLPSLSFAPSTDFRLAGFTRSLAARRRDRRAAISLTVPARAKFQCERDGDRLTYALFAFALRSQISISTLALSITLLAVESKAEGLIVCSSGIISWLDPPGGGRLFRRASLIRILLMISIGVGR